MSADISVLREIDKLLKSLSEDEDAEEDALIAEKLLVTL
jgi:hypothetical protein